MIVKTDKRVSPARHAQLTTILMRCPPPHTGRTVYVDDDQLRGTWEGHAFLGFDYKAQTWVEAHSFAGAGGAS